MLETGEQKDVMRISMVNMPEHIGMEQVVPHPKGKPHLMMLIAGIVHMSSIV